MSTRWKNADHSMDMALFRMMVLQFRSFGNVPLSTLRQFTQHEYYVTDSDGNIRANSLREVIYLVLATTNLSGDEV